MGPYKRHNSLSLEERVQVIREYEKDPSYRRLAIKFVCNPNQIKSIIKNKKHVLLYHNNLKAKRSSATENRWQNVLTLEERVKVIREYEQSDPKLGHTFFAKKYKCYPQQIKNIIANKETLLLYYNRRMADSFTEDQRNQRQQQIIFLGKVIHEYIQRILYQGVFPSATDVQEKAFQVKNLIKIHMFTANNTWIQNLMAKYKIAELDLKNIRTTMFPGEVKEESLKAVDIIEFVKSREKSKDQLQDNIVNNIEMSSKNKNVINCKEVGEPTIIYEDSDDFEVESKNSDIGANYEYEDRKDFDESLFSYELENKVEVDSTYSIDEIEEQNPTANSIDEKDLQDPTTNSIDDNEMQDETTNNCSNSQQDPQDSSSTDQPSFHRYRNILTLEERFQAIRAYDRDPIYTNIARMFNCSWEQVKNIVMSRKSIMEVYKVMHPNEALDTPDLTIDKQAKIDFLGECLFQYLKRAQYHAEIEVNDLFIRSIASKFGKVLQIGIFIPNKVWLKHFKGTYKLSLFEKKKMPTSAQPSSLDIKDIITHCSRYKVAISRLNKGNPHSRRRKKKISEITEDNVTPEELKQRREQKICFLGKALFEYIQRLQFHHDTPLSDILLQKIACDLNDILAIADFYPNTNWLTNFKLDYNLNPSQRMIVISRTPSSSLDLRDIISYCSRPDKKDMSLYQKVNEKRVQVEKHKKVNEKRVQVERLHQDQYPAEPLNSTTAVAATTTEIKNEQEYILSDVKIEPEEDDNNDDFQPPLLKTPKIEIKSEDDYTIISVNSVDNTFSEANEESNKNILDGVQTYNDALKLLKLIEEFAMLEQNYRAIGLITQLEDVLKYH